MTRNPIPRTRLKWRLAIKSDKGLDVTAGGFDDPQDAFMWLDTYIAGEDPVAAGLTAARKTELDKNGYVEIVMIDGTHLAITMSASSRETDNGE